MAAAVAGDRKALESLVTELLPRVRNLVRYLVRGDEDVDDLSQEALVAIVRALPGYRGDGTLRSWADRVTTRLTITQVRKGRSRIRQVEAGAELEAVPDPGAGADEYALRRSAAVLLDQLPDNQRRALVMHHILGLSVQEISEELEVPFETVRSRLRIGMDKLRSLVPEEER